MNFRRIPFQFTTTNPSCELEALRKRFGLANQNKMILDYGLGNGVGECNSVDCSPRLQHRVPVFVKDPNKSIDKSESNNDHSRKSNVRIVPIEIEGASKHGRQRTYSGPARTGGESEKCNDCVIPGKHQIETEMSCRKRIPSENSTPKVVNIPVKVLKSNNNVPYSESKLNHSIKDNKTVCTIPVYEEKPIRKAEPEVTGSFKKIHDVLEEFKSYEERVKNYNGSGNDKEYRYLDEMFTRCMLRLDDVETMGNAEIRFARKNAITKVQSCIDFLEAKINAVKGPKLSSSENNEKIPKDHMDKSLIKCEENNEKESFEMKDKTEASNANCPDLRIDSNDENMQFINNEDRKDVGHEMEMKDEKSENEMLDRDCSEIEMKDENELSNKSSHDSKIGADEENLLLLDSKDGYEIEMKEENLEIEKKEESLDVKMKVSIPEIEIKEEMPEIELKDVSHEIEVKEDSPEIEMKDEGLVRDFNCPTNKIDTDEESGIVIDHQSNTKTTLPNLANCEVTTNITVNEEHSMLQNEAQDTVPSYSNNSIDNYEVKRTNSCPIDNCEMTVPNNSQDGDIANKDEGIVNATEIKFSLPAVVEPKNLKEGSSVPKDSLLCLDIQNSELEQSDKITPTIYGEYSSDYVNTSRNENR